MAKSDGKDLVEQNKPEGRYSWIEKMESKFVLPKGTVSKERFMRSAIMTIAQNEDLKRCSLSKEGRDSIIFSIGRAADLGLEVGPLLGQVWLIPYNETRRIKGQETKIMICHFQLGYKGLIELALRSGKIKSISAEIVYDKDFFEIELGMGRHLTHKPNFREDRGKPFAYYFLAELESGSWQFAVMTKVDCLKHRDKYSKAKSKDSPWFTNEDAMCLKTVIRKGLNLCPKSIELSEAISKEDEEMRNVTDTTDFNFDTSEQEEPEDSEQEIQDIEEEPKKKPEIKEDKADTTTETGVPEFIF